MAPPPEEGEEREEEMQAAASLASRCPAFSEGCPYKEAVQPVLLGGVHATLEGLPLASLQDCPAFVKADAAAEGGDPKSCPFSKATEVGEVGAAMSQMPASHSRQGTRSHDALVQSLKVMHSASMVARERLQGRACPVFDNGCPFKQCVTTSGRPVVLEMEARAWFGAQEEGELAVDDAQAEIQEEPTPPSVGGAAQLDINLSKMLKVGTQAAHKEAESGSFVKRLLRGKSSPEEYRRLLVDLHHVYAALEDSLERAATELDHPIVKQIHFPMELNRRETLESDLDYWFAQLPGEGGWSSSQPSEQAQEYAARIRELAIESGTCHMLVAHAYTRYLGDLSGGQLLKRSICRAMPVGKAGEGVAFYDFEHVPNQKEFKNRYRDQLDELDVSPALADEMVEEANKAFDFNGAIFAHLDELAGIAPRPVAKAAEKFQLPAGHPELPSGGDASLAQCPFAALAAQAKAEEKAEAATEKAQAAVSANKHAPVKQPRSTTRSQCVAAAIGSLVLFGPVVAAMAVYAMGN